MTIDEQVSELKSRLDWMRDNQSFEPPLPPPVPPVPSNLRLDYLGAIRLPPHGKHPQFNTDLFARGRQQIAPVHGATDEVWATYIDVSRGYMRHVGKLKLPAEAPVLVPDGTSPRATWVIAPVIVGEEFQQQVVASTSQTAWAWLTGVADDGVKLHLNYGQYYWVQAVSYRNLSSISHDLDPASEVFRDRPTGDPPTKQLAGWMVIHDGKLYRGDFWSQGSNGGPWASVVVPDGPSEFALRYSTAAPIDGWASDDDWTSLFFLTAPDGTKYRAISVRKGTAPGWYGGADYADGPNGTKVPIPATNTIDLCSTAKGRHAHPYTAELWLFLDDGSISPQPVKKIPLPEFGTCARISGGAILGDVLWLVHDQAYRPTPTAYESHNLLRAYRIAWE